MKFKIILASLLVLLTHWAQAQMWEGTYQTQYGAVKLVYENGIYYGDYAGNGTVLAFESNNTNFELHGVFFNGNARGKFLWRAGANLQVQGFSGHFAYDNTVSLQDLRGKGIYFISDFQTGNSQFNWNGKRTSTSKVTDLQTAVWSGKWTTNFADLVLEQVGNQVTGKYGNVGDIKATFDKSKKVLKGTFTNNGRTGYLEFAFTGNGFTGKWGWNQQMTENPAWTGTKSIKSNKPVPVVAASSSTKKITVRLASILAEEIPSNRNPEIYGFAGVRVYRVTASGREEIRSFGNKNANYFDRTENNPFPRDSRYAYRVDLANTPDYLREFTISAQDLNNPNVDIELEVWHHVKGKVLGPNFDLGYHKEVLNLEGINFERGGLLRVGQGYRNGQRQSNLASKSQVMIYVTGF
ncbi:hypothetical protein [Algoriphagus taiwanensis]|uniref:Uncharacterized protein n=1 Tax=Algoriphagus taiwanensis TaxID=1445656 RepID=A0ABQ6Q5T4_9BACT|nr:hypothetical protein Ataiwa_32680 [Algoriphagus taiwanensis]